MKILISPDRIKALEKISQNNETLENVIEKAVYHFKNKLPIPEHDNLNGNYGKKQFEIEFPAKLYQFFHSLSNSRIIELIIDIYVADILKINRYFELNINYDYSIYEKEN